MVAAVLVVSAVSSGDENDNERKRFAAILFLLLPFKTIPPALPLPLANAATATVAAVVVAASSRQQRKNPRTSGRKESHPSAAVLRRRSCLLPLAAVVRCWIIARGAAQRVLLGR
jgi:hypothetical protein